MEIIQPAHHIVAAPVKNWKEIEKDALELRDFIRYNKFKGLWEKAYAISHAQVSNSPKNFFVLNEGMENGILKKMFGSWCIVNPEIIWKDDLYLVDFKDACMSFPFRQPKNIQRYYIIKVKYYVPFLGFLRKKVKRFENIPAFIVQHEGEHSQGKNIYGL